LRHRREQFVNDRAERQKPFEVNAEILAAVEELRAQTSRVSADLAQLAREEKVFPLEAEPSASEPVAIEAAPPEPSDNGANGAESFAYSPEREAGLAEPVVR